MSSSFGVAVDPLDPRSVLFCWCSRHSSLKLAMMRATRPARSLDGGLVRWQKGEREDARDSVAIQVRTASKSIKMSPATQPAVTRRSASVASWCCASSERLGEDNFLRRFAARVVTQAGARGRPQGVTWVASCVRKVPYEPNYFEEYLRACRKKSLNK